MLPTILCQQAAAALQELVRRRLYDRYTDLDLLVLRIDDDPQPLLVTILGAAGIDIGLLVHQGPGALAALRAMQAGERQDGTGNPTCSLWSLSVDRPDCLPPTLRTVATRAGCKGREVPIFLVDANRPEPREPDADELRAIVTTLRGILLAEEQGLLRPRPLPPSGPVQVQQLLVATKGRDLAVRAEPVTLDDGSPPPPPLQVLPPPSLVARGVANEHWAVTLALLPMRVDGDPRAMFGLLLVDLEDDTILALELVPGGGLEDATAILLAQLTAKRQAGAKPPRLLSVAHPALHAVLVGPLRQIGVECRQEAVPVLEEILEELAEDPLGTGPRGEDEFGDDEIEDEFDGDDDDAYGNLDQLHALASTHPDWKPTQAVPVGQYFGCDVDPDTLSAADLQGYENWYLFYFRTRSDRPTMAERLLAAALPEPLRHLLQAAIAAPASLWRVESNRDGQVSLADVCSEQRVVVIDPDFERRLHPRQCVPGKAVPLADGTRILVHLGRVLTSAAPVKKLPFLQMGGAVPSAAAVAAAPHLFGRLWQD